MPAYFDFEGMWALRFLNEAPVTYPKPISECISGVDRGPFQGGKLAWPSRDLLEQTAFEKVQGELTSTFLYTRLSFAQRRLLRDRRFVRRYFLNLPELLSYRETGLRQVVFVSGLARDGESPKGLLGDLLTVVRVAPFLFAFDSARVILAALSSSPSRPSSSRGSVVGVLSRYLRNIEVIREDLDGLSPIIDHAYGRLVGVVSPRDSR